MDGIEDNGASRSFLKRSAHHEQFALFAHRKKRQMQLGMIGLGPMGSSMVRRLLKNGHASVVHDVQPSATAELVRDGATGAASLQEMVSRLAQPRAIWLMLPAAVVDQALGDLMRLLDAGDIVVDGGNSHCHDDMRGRWTIQAAIDKGVPTPVLNAALYSRFLSRGNGTFSNRIRSAMRHEFGGHAEKAAP